MNRQPRVDFRRRFAKPIELVFWASILGVTALSWFLPLPPDVRRNITFLAVATSIFAIGLFHWIVPRFGMRDWVNLLGIMGAIIFISCGSYLFKPYNVDIEILYLGCVASIGMFSGRRAAVRTTLLSAIAWAIITILSSEISTVMLVTLGLQILVILLAGFLISFLAGVLHDQVVYSEQQNRDLFILLQAGNIASKSVELGKALPSITELIARNIPATTCRISLLNQEEESLENYASYPQKPLVGRETEVGKSYSLNSSPLHKEVLESGKPLVVHDKNAGAFISQEEKSNFFFNDVKTVCMVPLIAKGKRLGVISIGEARSWERAPFNKEQISLLNSLATQVSGLIYNAQLYQASQRHAEHLAVLNRVANAISATLELNKLLELIYEQLSTVIPSDTYFISLYNPIESVLDIRILINSGKRYPPTEMPLGKDLASWVIETKQPLLVQHLSNEKDTLPFKPIILGQQKVPESWLAVPMMIGDQALGILTLASFKPYAYDNEDVVLMSNVASQAALAIDNARRHAEVEEQARRDSLTGAYNHGHLLVRLNEEVDRARKNQSAVSLIMLDIDYFKEYNDTYGHVIGDEVLCMLVKAIQSHVKKDDTVGRWGGEEFSVALPETSTGQALVVAERIRSTLASMELTDKSGNSIAKPTVSQGIATFPQDAKDAAELVDIADEALYIAKQRGRDQIMVAVRDCAIPMQNPVEADLKICGGSED
jgi:diguanylate cyclase (GGDEF)-like protein